MVWKKNQSTSVRNSVAFQRLDSYQVLPSYKTEALPCNLSPSKLLFVLLECAIVSFDFVRLLIFVTKWRVFVAQLDEALRYNLEGRRFDS